MLGRAGRSCCCCMTAQNTLTIPLFRTYVSVDCAACLRCKGSWYRDPIIAWHPRSNLEVRHIK